MLPLSSFVTKLFYNSIFFQLQLRFLTRNFRNIACDGQFSNRRLGLVAEAHGNTSEGEISPGADSK